MFLFKNYQPNYLLSPKLFSSPKKLKIWKEKLKRNHRYTLILSEIQMLKKKKRKEKEEDMEKEGSWGKPQMNEWTNIEIMVNKLKTYKMAAVSVTKYC